MVCFLMILRPPCTTRPATLCPYPTLYRAVLRAAAGPGDRAIAAAAGAFDRHHAVRFDRFAFMLARAGAPADREIEIGLGEIDIVVGGAEHDPLIDSGREFGEARHQPLDERDRTRDG